jgi:hypothetical protein
VIFFFFCVRLPGSPLWRSQLSGFKLCCCLPVFAASVLCSCHVVSSEAPKWSALYSSVTGFLFSQTFGLSSSLTHGLYPSTLGLLNPNVLDMLATNPLDGLYPTALDVLATNDPGDPPQLFGKQRHVAGRGFFFQPFWGDFADMVSRPSCVCPISTCVPPVPCVPHP